MKVSDKAFRISIQKVQLIKSVFAASMMLMMRERKKREIGRARDQWYGNLLLLFLRMDVKFT